MRINPYLSYQNKMSQNTSSTLTGDNKSAKQMSDTEVGSTLRQMGLTASDGLKRAYKTYSENGVTPTKEALEATNRFLNKSTGTEAQKQLTVSVVAVKGIEPTEENLNAVHVALNETNQTSEAVETLTQKEISTKTSALTQEEKLEKFNKLPVGLKTRLLGALKTLGLNESEMNQAASELASGSSTYLKSKLGAGASQTIDAMLLAVKIEQLGQVVSGESGTAPSVSLGTTGVVTQSDLIKVLNQLIEDVAPQGDSLEHLKTLDKVDLKALAAMLSKFMAENQNGSAGLKWLMKKLEAMMDETSSVVGTDSKIGFSSESLLKGSAKDGEEKIQVNLNKMNKNTESEWSFSSDEAIEVDDLEDAMANDEAFQKVLNTLQAMSDAMEGQINGVGAQVAVADHLLNTPIKLIAITEVTTDMLKIKETFDTFKNQAVAQLSEVQTGKCTGAELSDVVQKVAQKLDKLIMHSDLTLYTDMKSERKLMGISSDLQQIADLAKHQPQKALEQLAQAKKQIEALAFNPSKEVVVAKLKENVTQRLSEGTEFRLKEMVPTLEKIGNSSKGVLDVMRQLGLNHEVELMDEVFSSQSKQSDGFESHKDNFKQILLKLAEEDQGDTQTVKAIEKSLSQITGQQLLNKNEEKSDTQSLFFNIPLQQGDRQTDMKLYVKARKKIQAMDWENCSMYMLVDLKQYGETGIRIGVNQRQLSISISNASESIMDVVKPFAQEVMSQLKEVGYQTGDIKFVPFQTDISELPASKIQVETASIATQGKEGGRFEWQI